MATQLLISGIRRSSRAFETLLFTSRGTRPNIRSVRRVSHHYSEKKKKPLRLKTHQYSNQLLFLIKINVVRFSLMLQILLLFFCLFFAPIHNSIFPVSVMRYQNSTVIVIQNQFLSSGIYNL